MDDSVVTEISVGGDESVYTLSDIRVKVWQNNKALTDSSYANTLVEDVFSGNDEIVGSNHDDQIIGYRGADELFGGGGNDFLHGGHGRDFIQAGPGDDTIRGGHGHDTIWAYGGSDWIWGGLGRNEIVADGVREYGDLSQRGDSDSIFVPVVDALTYRNRWINGEGG